MRDVNLLAATPGVTPLDWGVIAAYGLGMLAIGWAYSRRNRSAEEYLLGGRNMRPASIGLSLFATLFSTITYLGMPGEMINKGPAMLAWMLAIPFIYWVVGYLLILRLTVLRESSAYAILERRLGRGVRLLGASMFLLTRLLWMALIIYVTADKVIVRMMNWDPSRTPWVAAAIGLTTVVYASMGGLRAVVLTDVIQSLILFGAALAAILLITLRLGGVGAWVPTEWSASWDRQPLLSLDPTVRASVIGSIVTMTLWWICTSGSDQMAIQRDLATRDAKAARRAFLITALANAAVTCVLAALGFALLAFFRANPQSGLSIAKNADELLTYYLVHFLPPGATGLVLAGLLAAAMSSLSSGINSAGAVISSDFFEAHTKGAGSETTRFRRARLISWLSGLLTVSISLVLSLLMSRVSGNTLEVTIRTNHIFVAPLFGLFFMAMFVPFATGSGAALGALAGCAVAITIAYWDILTGGPVLSFQWISLLSLAAHLSVGCAVSGIQKCWRTHRENAEGSPAPRA